LATADGKSVFQPIGGVLIYDLLIIWLLPAWLTASFSI